LLFDLHKLHHFTPGIAHLRRALLAHSRVKRRQDDRLAVLILECAVLRLEVVQCEAINRLLVFVAVVATTVIVCVLFLNHLAFLVVEKLDGGVHVFQPGVA